MITGPVAWSYEKSCNLYLEQSDEPQLISIVQGQYLSFRKWVEGSMSGFEYRLGVEDVVDISVTDQLTVEVATIEDGIKTVWFYEGPADKKQTLHSDGTTGLIGMGPFANKTLAERFKADLEALLRLLGEGVLIFDALEHAEWDD